MKTAYEKPVILRLETGYQNKFGSSPMYARKVRKDIDGVSIDALVAEHGSPLFVFSERTMREKFREVHEAFATRYPNVVQAWSYKTNYLQAVCSVFHSEGALAEVVSEFEYDKARKLGVPGSQIIFNGPHKPMEALRKAVTEGAQIHVDHLDEIQDLEALAQELGRQIPIGMRLNMDTGIHPQWTRFGLNLDSGQAMDAVKRIHARGHLVLKGLHAHIGTFILEPDAYGQETAKMARFATEVSERFGYDIEYLDIGGGFPSRNKLKGTYLPPDVAVPSVDAFAERITDALFANLPAGVFPRLILETGRALVDEAGFLVTTIFASKRLPDGRRTYVADAGLNDLFTAFWYKFNVELDREVQGMNEPAMINGPLCMNIDVLDEGILLPPLRRGTRLIFSPVGAYNVTQWMQFIEYRPAVVMVGEDGSVELIREREDLTDIERRERLPQRLTLG
ncbi:MAG: alanine racemase [Gemmatimonadota bacterium]|jgi:diaminopimelate decarboxylase